MLRTVCTIKDSSSFLFTYSGYDDDADNTKKEEILVVHIVICVCFLCLFAVKPTVIHTDMFVNSIGPVNAINMVSTTIVSVSHFC